MATPPREGWDGERASEGYGNKDRGERRTRWAQEAGYDSWGEWVEEREAESRWDSICGRPTRDHEPCGLQEAWNVRDEEGACRTHRGGEAKGPAHPAYKDGDHVRTTLPENLKARAEEIADHGPLDVLLENRAVLSKLRDEAWEELSESAGPDLRERLSEVFEEIGRAGSKETLQERLEEAFRLVEAGVEADAAHDRLISILEEYRRTAEAQRRMMVDLEQVLTVPEALTLVEKIRRLVERAVDENLTERRLTRLAEKAEDFDDLARRMKRRIFGDLTSGIANLLGRGSSSERERAGREVEGRS